MKTKKIVINTCFGGFRLSDKAVNRLNELGFIKDGLKINSSYDLDINDRSNPFLIQVIEELGKEADTIVSSLAIVEIPYDVDYIISEYDGMEVIEEKHRSWS